MKDKGGTIQASGWKHVLVGGDEQVSRICQQELEKSIGEHLIIR